MAGANLRFVRRKSMPKSVRTARRGVRREGEYAVRRRRRAAAAVVLQARAALGRAAAGAHAAALECARVAARVAALDSREVGARASPRLAGRRLINSG